MPKWKIEHLFPQYPKDLPARSVYMFLVVVMWNIPEGIYPGRYKEESKIPPPVLQQGQINPTPGH
jgi:hypothetical protein